jgi:hypothetical protein
MEDQMGVEMIAAGAAFVGMFGLFVILPSRLRK